MGYTRVDNWLFDEVMPNVRGNTFKVIAAVARKTWGWKKNSDRISVRQFSKITGIVGRSNILNAIDLALASGYIERAESGQTFTYRICNSTTGHDLGPADSTAGHDLGPATGHDLGPVELETGHDLGPTKEKKNLKETIKDADLELAEHFTSITGLMSNPGVYVQKWKIPLEAMLNGAGGIDETKAIIAEAVKFARANGYTVVSPLSIVNIAANLKTNTPKLEISAV